MEEIVLGIDIGTTKICALVGEVRNREMRIIGLGMQPSAGMRKGMIVDVPSASVALAAALEAAEQTSGYQLSQALISVAGEHISSTNNRGLVAINRNEDGVTPQDIDRRVRELGRLIGYGVTLALQPGLTQEDATTLLG